MPKENMRLKTLLVILANHTYPLFIEIRLTPPIGVGEEPTDKTGGSGPDMSVCRYLSRVADRPFRNKRFERLFSADACCRPVARV